MLRVFLLSGILLAAVMPCLGQELVTRIQDRAQLEAIRALVEKHAPGAKVFRIDEVPVLPTFNQYLVSVWYDKQPRNPRRYTYRLLEFVRPSERSRSFKASHPFDYSLHRQTDTPKYDVFSSPKAKKDILVAPSIPDETVDRVLDFIEKQGEFTYARGRGGQAKKLMAADILSREIVVTTSDKPGVLQVLPGGRSLTLKIRVLPKAIELEGITAFVI